MSSAQSRKRLLGCSVLPNEVTISGRLYALQKENYHRHNMTTQSNCDQNVFKNYSLLLLYLFGVFWTQAAASSRVTNPRAQSAARQGVDDFSPADAPDFTRAENRGGTGTADNGRASSVGKETKKLNEALSQLSTEEILRSDEACHTKWINNENTKFQPLKSYGTLYDPPLSGENRNRRHITDVRDDAPSPAMYFPGHATLRWRPTGTTSASETRPFFSADYFTAELWLRPEGGQQNPAVVIEAQVDVSSAGSVWSVGIRTLEENGDRAAGFYFSTTNTEGVTRTIFSNRPYKPEKWAHVAVTSFSGTTKLFVDAVQVAVSHQRTSQQTPERNCSVVIVGGSGTGSSSFRGVAGKLMLWKQPRSQADIRHDMYNFDASNQPALLIKEDFENYMDHWIISHNKPEKVFESTPSEHSRLHFPKYDAPPCGQTICDNPDIVRTYADNWRLRKPKALRYNVVSINENNGGSQMVTREDLQRQNILLRNVFEEHNITWIPTLVNINNSSLKHKTIGCEPTKIGNRQCNRECMHARLGHDGGDCDVDESLCDPRKKGDGHCDSECNKIYHGWDLGDCCDPLHTDTDQTCFDPSSIHRAYLSITEYKESVGANNENQLSVLFANWTNPNSIGISTFPWDKHVFTVQGGTVVQLKSYTTREEMSGLVHELGHNLGLLHVHHGAHAISCDDVCAESEPSMTTGDLCEDTNPTPMNTRCGEPSAREDVCNILNFNKTPYENFMSYADGSCQNSFTPIQRARMHCYIDLVYGPWSESESPGPIPLPPKVARSSLAERSVTLVWAPPIDGKVVDGRRNCDSRCSADGSLRQFAVTASSPDASTQTAWSPDQATGTPDQEPCTLRGVHFWMPSGPTGDGVDCTTGCYIDLGFDRAVVPALIRIWVTYGVEDGMGIKLVELRHEDQTVTTLHSVHGYCDMPLSIRVETKKKTKLIRIYVHRPYTAIDAVEVISEENNPLCAGCRNLKYKIHRDPPFPDDVNDETELLAYTDEACEEGVDYTYSIQPILRSLGGEVSPAVRYRLGQTFCGDQKIQEINDDRQSEQCDDGNADDGDGCDHLCRIEADFNCKGEPSLCYRYDGDGECESFEDPRSPDCMLPPTGYADYWAVEASSSSEAVEALVSSDELNICPSKDNTLGSPDAACQLPGLEEKMAAWSPCIVPGLPQSTGDHWIKVVYEEAVLPDSVILYFANPFSPRLEDLTLILPGGESVPAAAINVSCAASPAVVSLPANNNRAPVKDIVIKFSSADVLIDAVALRTRLGSADVIGGSPQPQSCATPQSPPGSNITCQYKGMSVLGGTAARNETECFVRCLPGFLPNLPQKTVCVNGIWEGTADCSPVDCGQPDHVRFAASECPSGHVWNAVCNFTCLKNTRRVGSDSTFRCDEGGNWSTPAASCEPICSVPPKIGFAFSSCSALSRRVSMPGDTCKYRCKNGYHVTQPPLNRRTFRLTCDDDGIWKGPGCQPVMCPDLKTKFKGTHRCTRSYWYGSHCTVTCQKGSREVTEVVRCESDGEWNSTFSQCPLADAATCPTPVGPQGVNIACTGHGTEQSCEARCTVRGRRRYDIVALSEVGVGETLLEEAERKVLALVCTGGSWFPEPDLLSCVDECDRHSMGNGVCDDVNNRQYCSWDGGDCCQSTVRKDNVSALACGGNCRCKDPNAVENLPKNKEPSEVGEYKDLLLPLNAPKSGEMTVSGDTAQKISDLDGGNALDHNGDGRTGSEVPKPRKRKKPRGRSSGRHRGRKRGNKKTGGKKSKRKRKRKKPDKPGSKKKNKHGKKTRKAKKRKPPA